MDDMPSAPSLSLGDGLPREVEPDPKIPGYEVLAVLGVGGMGAVYHARQLQTQREVALKVVIGRGAGDARLLKRFEFEAQAAASLDHPNIVPIYEVGEHDGRPYFTMKYIEGKTLAQSIAQFATQPASVVRLMSTIARGVQHAHERGILHRDLKPANIMLDMEGRPHLTDFGLARPIGGQSDLTETGRLLGTPMYISPEAIAGHREAITVASDVWGLGTILYEMLAGTPPFKGSSLIETLQAVENDSPPGIRHQNSRVDRTLEAICLRCLERRPQDRYASAGALADDLDAYLLGDAVVADGGRAARLLSLILRDSRHVEIMRRWARVWLCCSAVFLFGGAATTAMHAGHIASDRMMWTLMFAIGGLLGVAIWVLRFRGGPPPTHVERQLASIWAMFIVAFFLTGVIRSRLGLPPGRLIPVAALECALVFGCTAVLLGGSFYVLAILCAILSIVIDRSLETGPLSLCTTIAVGLLVPALRHWTSPGDARDPASGGG